MSQTIREQVEQYYTARLDKHGNTHWGVDWNSTESQVLRFEQLLKLHTDPEAPFSINDYGCGYGALIDNLNERGYKFDYTGYDVAPAMIAAAQQAHPAHTFTSDDETLQPATYTVASGVFNVRMEFDDETWQMYILETLDVMWAVSSAGMAFNCLTSYSDPPCMRENSYYTAQIRCFYLYDHCSNVYSGHIMLLHDYGLYEFTMLVRREANK